MPLKKSISTGIKGVSTPIEKIVGKKIIAAKILFMALISLGEKYLVFDLQIKLANVQEKAANIAAITPSMA